MRRKHPDGGKVRLPQKHHLIRSPEEINSVIETTGRNYLKDDLHQHIHMIPYYVWFAPRAILIVSEHIIVKLGSINDVRVNHVIKIPQEQTKTEWENEQVKLRRISDRNKRVTKEGLQYLFNSKMARITVDEFNKKFRTDIPPEDFEDARFKHVGRQNSQFIFDSPSRPTNLISANCLQLPKSRWCEEHFLARQRAGEDIFLKFINGGLSFEEFQDLIYEYSQVNYVHPKENTRLVKDQKNPENDFTSWETFYDKWVSPLLRVLETKGDYATLVEKDGVVMTREEAIKLYATPEENDVNTIPVDISEQISKMISSGGEERR